MVRGHEKRLFWPLIPPMRSLVSAESGFAPRDAVSPVPARAEMDFEAVYREHFRFVWRTVRRMGVEDTQIDDVVQEIFLVVHRQLGGFEGRSSAKTWLYGIIRRVIATQRRTQRRKPAHCAQDELDAMMHPKQGPEASAEQAERVRRLHQLLAELGDDKREVFVLAELEGLSMLEIADAIHLNPNTVASRLRAARREFEAALERAIEGDAAFDQRTDQRRPR
jgi:RNA polymerase sigma-70 factor, ECF subfamily